MSTTGKRFSVFAMQRLSAEFLTSAFGQLAEFNADKGEISWSERITGNQFRRLRELSTGTDITDRIWTQQLDAMIAEQEEGDNPVEGPSGPATRWGEVNDAMQQGLTSETWVNFLERYRGVVMRIIHKYGSGQPAVMEVPSFDGFLSWFCQTERLDRIKLRSEDGHVNAFRAWLYYQVRAYLNYCSMTGRKIEALIDSADAELILELEDSAAQINEAEVTREKARQLAQEALSRLESRDKESYDAFVFRSRNLSGLEIAALLGCSEATVSRRFAAALVALRADLNASLGNDPAAQDLLLVAQEMISLCEE